MGYHKQKIQKGELGHASKIREEYEEFGDAYEQGNPVMELVELSDLLGAIEAYTIKHFNVDLEDLIKMTRATQSAFKDGGRKSTNPDDYPCGEIPLTTDVPAEYKITINGRQETIVGSSGISYEAILIYAGYAPQRIISVTYCKGHHSKPSGCLSPLQSVVLRSGMVFTACDTSNA